VESTEEDLEQITAIFGSARGTNIALNWVRKDKTGGYGQANENIQQNKIGCSGGWCWKSKGCKSRKVVSKKYLG
jgi:hypothetical protein